MTHQSSIFSISTEKKNLHFILRGKKCIFQLGRILFRSITFFFPSFIQFSHSVMSDALQPPWTAVFQASMSITNSWSLLRFMSIELVMPSNHLILCHPLLLLPSIFPSIRVFSNESALRIRWLKY